jgi:hypothetical protein
MQPSRIKAVLAALTFAAGSLVAAAPLASATTSCYGCEGAQFTADGVRIHSCASLSCTVVGLGYKSNTVRVYCLNTPYKNGFVHIDDLTTGVSGWSAEQYVLWGCD